MNDRLLHSDMLSSILTERPASIRILGKSTNVTVNSTALILVTGNALTVVEDLARRLLQCELDAQVEDPESRPFEPGFLDSILAKRGELLAAVLAFWRWGRQNKPKRGK